MNNEPKPPIQLSVHESANPSDIVPNGQEAEADLDDLNASLPEEDFDPTPTSDGEDFDNNQIAFANRTGG